MDVELKTLVKILKNAKENNVHESCKLKNCNHKFFTEKIIGDLEKDKNLLCFKKLNLMVIDFDETEIKLRPEKSRSKKSCDAVKFVTNKDRTEIHFIEMKSILNFEKDNKIKSGNDRRSKIEKFEFYKKIRDSLLIMSEVIEHKNIKLNPIEIELYYKIAKFPILLVDIDKDSEEGFKFTLEFLSFKTELEKVGKNDAHNLQEAKLAYCGNFDEKYNN